MTTMNVNHWCITRMYHSWRAAHHHLVIQFIFASSTQFACINKELKATTLRHRHQCAVKVRNFHTNRAFSMLFTHVVVGIVFTSLDKQLSSRLTLELSLPQTDFFKVSLTSYFQAVANEYEQVLGERTWTTHKKCIRKCTLFYSFFLGFSPFFVSSWLATLKIKNCVYEYWQLVGDDADNDDYE